MKTSTRNERQFRQGDLLLELVAREPPGPLVEVPRENGRLVLLHGEATGHSHAISEPSATLFRRRRGQDGVLRITEGGARLRHEEHATLELPPGLYRIRRQRQYSPDEVRSVTD